MSLISDIIKKRVVKLGQRAQTPDLTSVTVNEVGTEITIYLPAMLEAQATFIYRGIVRQLRGAVVTSVQVIWQDITKRQNLEELYWNIDMEYHPLNREVTNPRNESMTSRAVREGYEFGSMHPSMNR